MVRKWIWIRGYRDRRRAERDLVRASVDPAMGEWDFALGIHGWKGKFEVVDERWAKLRDLAERSGVRALVSETIDYTEGDVNAAGLLELSAPPVDARGETGPEDGNEYDLSQACPLCLSGAKLIPPFRMDDADLPAKRPVAKTHAEEYLVSGDLADGLRRIDGSESWLLPVEDRDTRRALEWMAIVPEAVMPRIHPSTRGLKQTTGLGPPWDTCPRCARDCFGPRLDEALVLAYSRAEIRRACAPWLRPGESLPDVAGTWELMGPGTRQVPEARRQVAAPYIMLSQRVASEFRKRAAKWIKMSPVTLLA